MKILIVTPYFAPSVGGVQAYVDKVIKGFTKDHQVVVITSRLPGTEAYEDHGPVKIYRLPVWLKLSNTPLHPFWYFKIKKIIVREQPALINLHAPVPYMADVAVRAARSIPIVVTYHAGSMLKGTGGLTDALLRLYERFMLPTLFKKADRIAAVYPAFVLSRLARDQDKEKVSFVPPGIDTDLFVPRGDVVKKYDVLFVGRIERTSAWKGLGTFLEAVVRLVKTNPAAQVRIIGEGDALEDYRRKAVALGLENTVTFSGGLPPEALVEAYNEARIVVLPSETEAESFGMVLAEAMACGTAVIGSRVGGVPNVIADGQTGMLVTPKDSVELATAMTTLLADAHMQKRYGHAGRTRVVEQFSAAAQLARTKLIFAEAARSHVTANTLPEIVHVTANYPPRLGGLEKVVESLATEQHKKSMQVRVITSDQGTGATHEDAVPVTRLKSIEIMHTPLMPGLLPQLLRLSSRAVVHVHVAQAFTPEMVFLASLFKRFKYIAHVHLDIAPSGAGGFLLALYKPLVLKFVLRRAAYVAVFSDEQKKAMAGLYGISMDRIKVIPNGVSESFYYATPRKLAQKPRLLFVGRLNIQKNVGQLLDALKGVSEHFETHIVGDGELRTALETKAKQHGLQDVHFMGRKDGSELRDLYAKADIFVLPSEREGMPLVLLEAMAMALPVIGTDVTGIRDLVEDKENGFLVPLGNAVAFQEALLKLAADSGLHQKMSRKSYNLALQYSWETVAGTFNDVYQDAYDSKAH